MQTLDAPAVQALLERLQNLNSDTPARWGKMNAHQMICHLTDAYGLPLGTKTASADSGFLNRTLIRWVALHTNLKWPEGVPTRPEMDQQAGNGTRPVEFVRDKAALAAIIETFAAQAGTGSFPPHPIFGPLTNWEWRRWGYLHADHHFRQFGL